MIEPTFNGKIFFLESVNYATENIRFHVLVVG
jgi:hypothetical protein